MHVVTDAHTAIGAARAVVINHGYHAPLVLSSTIRGEARGAGKSYVAIAEESNMSGNFVKQPAIIISGGKTTVKQRESDGTGGPNQEFVSSAAVELDTERVVVASVDTDGIDGSSIVAGGIIDVETVATADQRAMVHDALRRNDVFNFLDRLNSAIKTGPTGTNVNYLRILIINEVSSS